MKLVVLLVAVAAILLLEGGSGSPTGKLPRTWCPPGHVVNGTTKECHRCPHGHLADAAGEMCVQHHAPHVV